MDQRYWNRIGAEYAGQVLDSLRADRRGVVMRRIERYADGRAVAADFGCGVGHYLPTLAEHFRRVHAFDFAATLIEQAKRRCAGLDNVTIRRSDLSRDEMKVRGVRFAVCANVLIMPSRGKRAAILANVVGAMARGGRLLMVVPAMESALFVHQRYVEWNVKRGVGRAAAHRAGLAADRRLLEGVLPLDGVMTKHYMEVELAAMLGEAGLGELEFDRANYGWKTEFPRPPAWMKGPYPWDWVVTGVKK